MSNETTKQPITHQPTAEQVKLLQVKKQAEQIKSLGLPADVEAKTIKSLYKSAGLEQDVPRFERLDYEFKAGKDAGKKMPLINIANPNGGNSKTITLWQAQQIVDDIDTFILYVEEFKESIKADGYLKDGKVIAK